MDEHKTSGVTEFLRREMQVWEKLSTGQGHHAKKQRRKIFLMALGIVISVAAIASAVYLVPWKELKLPLRDGGPGVGGNLPVTDLEAVQTQQETEVGSEQETIQNTPEVDLYEYDFSIVPAGATPIVPCNTAIKNNPVNQTDRVIDMQSVNAATCLIPAARGQISVLIIHTHTGEGYNQKGSLFLEADDEEFARSADGSDGVLAVGALLAQRLNQAGIGTIHCKTVFDGESNRESYNRAADAISAFRMAYPSLVCVIDVHRAASIDEQGNILRSLAVRDGKGIAQTQLICGMSAEQTSKTNLALAMSLHKHMNQAFPDSCAGVICKEQTLNQHLAPFSLTLEIGSCGNTLQEALDAAGITADALCALFETS